ncbi:MAG: DNA repair protein RecO [Phycisphaerales bacterium]|nr:DNA repair protein RecO [Phycisphaerales bacterium]
MPTIQDHAVCVRQWDWSETSQTVSLLTRDFGLIRCLAKGSKREKSAFSGGLEIATIGHMVAIVKPNTELAILTAWDLVDPMYQMRRSLDRYHASMFVIDLIPRLINDHDPHPEVFDAIVDTLNHLSDPSRCTSRIDLQSQLVWYFWQLLEHTGSRPELNIDVFSGEPLDDHAQVFGFNPVHGGLTLDPKQIDSPNGQHDLSDTWRVRRSTVILLRQLLGGARVDDLVINSEDQLERLGGLLASYLRYIVGNEIPSMVMMYPSI